MNEWNPVHLPHESIWNYVVCAGTPGEWLLENVACQLLISGDRVVQRYLTFLARKHRLFELANLVAAFSLVHIFRYFAISQFHNFAIYLVDETISL